MRACAARAAAGPRLAAFALLAPLFLVLTDILQVASPTRKARPPLLVLCRAVAQTIRAKRPRNCGDLAA